MTQFWIRVAYLVAPILALGACFFLLARWSRGRHSQLQPRFRTATRRSAPEAFAGRRWREYLELEFFGDVGPLLNRLATILIWFVIACVAAVLAAVGWVLVRATSSA